MKKAIIYIDFMIFMVVLGASDTLKGVFSTIFTDHFQLNATEMSMIVTMAYIGNLVFLFFGGKLVDKYRRKTAAAVICVIWLFSLVLYLCTDNYYCILIGMFFSLGASTLLATTLTVIIPTIFIATPGFIVNSLYFVQGIGTSGSQKLVGSYAKDFGSWKLVNGGLLIAGIVALAIFMMIRIPEEKKEEAAVLDEKQGGYRAVIKNPAFFYLVGVLGCYFVIEHGIMNWIVLYCNQQFHYSLAKSSNYLSLFYAGIMVGRLVFAPLVQKLGAVKSVGIFGTVGGIIYAAGILLGEQSLYVISFSGLILAIVYPTTLLMFRSYYRPEVIGTATGVIVSAASLFDIIFNMLFGKMIDGIGFEKSILLLPVFMALFVVIYVVFRKNVKTLYELS